MISTGSSFVSPNANRPRPHPSPRDRGDASKNFRMEPLRSIYRSNRQRLELAVDNEASHTSKQVERYSQDSGGRLLWHPLPTWNPQANPVELIWWGLHEAVSRNHQCAGLEDLVEFADGYFKERQPFHLKLPADYEHLERSPP